MYADGKHLTYEEGYVKYYHSILDTILRMLEITVHLQGNIVMTYMHRLTAVKKHVGICAHTELVRGSTNQNDKYLGTVGDV